MTTPKRYEEAAAKLALSFKNQDSFYVSDMRKVEEALRTAAREAQVRVLNEILPLYETGIGGAYQRVESAVRQLRKRIENGEDL